MKLPKILILIQPFNYNTGGGITLSNLFKGWPKDKLAVVCRPYAINSNTQIDICDTYYQLGQKEQTLKFPFNKFNTKYYSGVLEFENRRMKTAVQQKSKSRVKLLNEYLNPFLKWVGLQNAISKIELSEQLKDWLEMYKPDVIYAQAQRREDLLFCASVQEYLKIPMVFHMMDDWTELEDKGLMGSYWYSKIDREFKKTLSQCALHLSISDSMAAEYKKRYGYDFQTFHNPIEIDFWKTGKDATKEIAKNPTVLYAGRMGLGIEESLKMMARVVTQLNKELDASIRFIVQVSEKPDWLEKFPCAEYRGFVQYEDLPKKFAEADILYLPYDFSSKSLKFIKYSMPTKASEYMISGTPILIFAPYETAIVQYALQHKWAKVVTDNEEVVLKKALKELLLNQNERESIAQNAIQLAENKHAADKVRLDFKKSLASVM